jgi:hypothetical protein
MMLEFLPARAPAMELKIVGNQIILSGPVVGDEPEKVREASQIRRKSTPSCCATRREETRRPATR